MFTCIIFISIIKLTFLKIQYAESDYTDGNFRVLGLNIPSKLDFAGELVPQNDYEIKESLEQEFFANKSWKNSSLILFQKAQKWFPLIEPILKKEGVPDDFKYIALIESQLDVLALNGLVDYRLERLGGMDTWHRPLGDEATAQVREAFFRLTDYSPEDADHVPSAELDLGGGRKLHVPKALKGVAVFSFKRLCAEARGASDYLAIARRYHTVILVGIPRLGPENRNEAARFVTLIDALYEARVKLLVTAAASPEELYQTGDGRFEFERTISRLMEMQSAEYMALGHGED